MMILTDEYELRNVLRDLTVADPAFAKLSPKNQDVLKRANIQLDKAEAILHRAITRSELIVTLYDACGDVYADAVPTAEVGGWTPDRNVTDDMARRAKKLRTKVLDGRVRSALSKLVEARTRIAFKAAKVSEKARVA